MKFERSPAFGTGKCPMCGKSTHQFVHQKCGEARATAHQLLRTRKAISIKRIRKGTHA